jgi:hypothetical protein
MTPETRVQQSEMVRAIWNTDLTLKICLGEEIDQEETKCECPNDHNEAACHDAADEPVKCDALAWPKFNGPIVVSGDGGAHFCEDCVREIDPDFVDLYEDAFNAVRAFNEMHKDEGPNLDDWLEDMTLHFPPGVGIIERGSGVVL